MYNPTFRLWLKRAWHLLPSLGSVRRRPTLKGQPRLESVWLFQGDYSPSHQDDQSPTVQPKGEGGVSGLVRTRAPGREAGWGWAEEPHPAPVADEKLSENIRY